MGLAKPALRFIAHELRLAPLSGSVLTLGRQDVAATPEEMRRIIRTEGHAPAAVDARTAKGPRDVLFFRMLGFTDVAALDYSDYEGAEHIHDLNRPVPERLRGRFDLIIDGGTIEHVFDVRQSLMNIATMLRPGGRALHISPANNYANHGFYQFGPTLFFDYYSANGFANLRGFLAEQDTYRYDTRPWELFELAPSAERFTSPRPLMLLFSAEKTDRSTADRVPTQTFYRQMHAGQERRAGLVAALKRLVPVRTKLTIMSVVPALDPLRKPWGLKRRGRW